MQYREVTLCQGQLVNASAMTSKTDTYAAGFSNPPSAPPGGPTLTKTPIAGVMNLFQSEAPRAQSVKFVLYCESLVGAGALAAVQVRGIITLKDGTTRDILLGTFGAALNTAGQSETLDILNCPANVYLAYGTLSGTSITVSAAAILG